MSITKFYQNQTVQQTIEKLIRKPFFKSLNLHNTPVYQLDRLDNQLEFLSKKYCPVTMEDIHEYSLTGKWTKPRPGLIPALFEGYRNNFDIYYPLLEKHNMTGWFFVITDFMDVPEKEQREYALNHDIDPCERNDFGFGYPGEDRIAMNWDEIRELSKKHEIVCHTASHLSLSETDTDEFLHKEINLSKRKLEGQLDKEIEVFCTLWGHGYNYSEKIAKHIKNAGYKYVWGGYGAVERIAP